MSRRIGEELDWDCKEKFFEKEEECIEALKREWKVSVVMSPFAVQGIKFLLIMDSISFLSLLLFTEFFMMEPQT